MLKKNKNELTITEFLQFRPQRLDFEWFTDEEGFVQIIVPKFKSKLGKFFCKLLRRKDTFIAEPKPKKIASMIWKSCDGKNTVEDILEFIKKEYSKEGIVKNEEDLKNSLIWCLFNWKNRGFINF